MKKLLLLILTVFTFHSVAFSQQVVITSSGQKVLLKENGTWIYVDSVSLFNIKPSTLLKLEIPKTSSKQAIVTHTGFSLLYNEIHEQASWVAYDLTKKETNKLFDRTDKFMVDPKIKTETANYKDYEGSGFDRGHLAPAADMGWSSTTMAESFYYSNMSPQTPSFNRGIWKRLEELVRTWAIDNNSVYIVTGPVLTSNLSSIGLNKVSIPKYYYKVVLDYAEPSVKGIGFILPNIGSKGDLQQFAVSIDSVEKFTGIDFFPLLPDDQEEQIEKIASLNSWSWKNANSTSEKEENISSIQCNGLTQLGDRCEIKTKNKNGYCYLHESQVSNQTTTEDQPVKIQTSSKSVQCTGITKAGNRCKRMTLSAYARCYQH